MRLNKLLALLPTAALLVSASLPVVAQAAKAAHPAAKKAARQDEPKHDQVERISVDELILLVAKKKPVTIIDSRQLDSYDMKIKGALQIPVDQTEARIKEIPRNSEVVLYCA